MIRIKTMTLKNILLMMAAILFFYYPLQAKKIKTEERLTYLTDEDIKRIEETTWRINITSDIKNSYFNAIQFTVFETDPMPLLREQKKIAKKLSEGKNYTKLDKIIDTSTSWDLIFMEKTGAEVYLINAKASKKDSVMISANTKPGKKWLVSKVVQNKDGDINAWIIPFDAEIGKTIDLNFSEKNKFNFSDI